MLNRSGSFESAKTAHNSYETLIQNACLRCEGCLLIFVEQVFGFIGEGVLLENAAYDSMA